jgi:hypothetical protein
MDIVQKLIGPHPDSLFARLFLCLFQPAELSQSGMPRRGWRHSARNIPFDQAIEVLLELLADLAIASISLQQAG